MNSFQKYLTISRHDQNWGLYALDAGFSRISIPVTYPSLSHPSSYYFSWQEGRILDEYQVIYITEGEGVFESKRGGKQRVQEGSVILLFPREWHRYKPDERTGWKEYWVGFRGTMADHIIQNNFFSPYQPVINLGYKAELIELYYHISEKIRQAGLGYQQIIAGQIIHLLGKIYASSQETPLMKSEPHLFFLINKAKILLKENVEQCIHIEDIAKILGVSYSLFRKTFKKHTGISPGQYFIQEKIERAKLYLRDPNKRIKEVAYDLGFESCYYFSKLFKDKTGVSPEYYRRQILT